MENNLKNNTQNSSIIKKFFKSKIFLVFLVILILINSYYLFNKVFYKGLPKCSLEYTGYTDNNYCIKK